MITQQEIIRRMNKKLGVAVNYYELKQIMEQHNIKPKEVKDINIYISQTNSNFVHDCYMFEDKVIDKLIKYYVEFLETKDRAIAIVDLSKKYNVSNDSIWQILYRNKIPYITIVSDEAKGRRNKKENIRNC